MRQLLHPIGGLHVVRHHAEGSELRELASLVVIFLLFCVTSNASESDHSEVLVDSGPSYLDLHVVTLNASLRANRNFRIGEEIVIAIKVTNRTDRVVFLRNPTPMMPGVRDSHGVDYTWLGLLTPGRSEDYCRPIAAGEELVSVFSWPQSKGEGRGSRLDPGEYTVYVHPRAIEETLNLDGECKYHRDNRLRAFPEKKIVISE